MAGLERVQERLLDRLDVGERALFISMLARIGDQPYRE
jgi:hypothetical protein